MINTIAELNRIHGLIATLSKFIIDYTKHAHPGSPLYNPKKRDIAEFDTNVVMDRILDALGSNVPNYIPTHLRQARQYPHLNLNPNNHL